MKEGNKEGVKVSVKKSLNLKTTVKIIKSEEQTNKQKMVRKQYWEEIAQRVGIPLSGIGHRFQKKQENREKEAKQVFGKIMTENYPHLVKCMYINIQDA